MFTVDSDEFKTTCVCYRKMLRSSRQDKNTIQYCTVRPAWEFNQIGSIQFGFIIYIFVKKTFQGKQRKTLESKILSSWYFMAVQRC